MMKQQLKQSGGKINKEALENKYQELKKKYQKVNDVIILERYKILSEAYKVGKELYGKYYGLRTLAKDFEASYDSTKLFMCLDRANKRTWGLISKGAISPHKVCLIIRQKGGAFQDEIIDAVIKNNLGNEDIKKLKRIDNRGAYRMKELLRQKGYMEKKAAYRLFRHAVGRINHFTSLKTEFYPTSKHREMIVELERLKGKIDNYINILEKEIK